MRKSRRRKSAAGRSDHQARAARRFATKLFGDNSADLQLFTDCISGASAGLGAAVWLDREDPRECCAESLPRWCPPYVRRYRQETESVTALEAHQAGSFYRLDLSSVFCAAPLAAVPQPVSIVLDLCSSPGGKALLAWRHFKPQRLICNEVIGKRHAALISNLQRCRVTGVVVTRSDSSWFAETQALKADLVIVDAPCSGQSLPARGKRADGCFSEPTINANAMRQRRILANAVQALTPGGCMLYCTCTFSLEENERNLEWVCAHHPQLECRDVDALEAHRSSFSTYPCYRLWPWQGWGAGGFTCLLQSREPASDATIDESALRVVWRYGG